MSGPTVFISYSHKDKDLLGPLVAQLKALEQAGLLEVWADTRIDAGDKWYPEIEGAMKRAAVAVCLVSEYFLGSNFCTKQEVPFLLKRSADEGLLIVPVLLSDCVWQAHRWLKDTQMLPGDSQSVRTHFPQNPAAVFVRAAKRIYDKLNDPTYRPPIAGAAWPPLAADRIDVARLPETGAALFGREQEIELLNAVWAGAGKTDSERTRVLAFTAHGGVGKSTLINHWLAEMKRDNYRGASRAFGWSFYSQGVREQGSASADAFIGEALKFFGDETMASSAASAWDKGERLSHLIGGERALLVLDGMEPLQSGQPFERGKLRDPALESLLRGLAKESTGLCLVTTRESLPDLANKPGFAERDLEQITPQAGRALLRTARVVGTDTELESLALRFGPHALAISLLGVYLHEQPGHGVGPAQGLEQMPGKQPLNRVLSGFEQWLGDSAEREVLCLLGLFDRPADADCLKALRNQPAIPGLTNRVSGLSDMEWNLMLNRLEKLRLIHARESDSAQRLVDAHPLIREHFAEQLREKNPTAWRAAHRRLYEQLCETTSDKKFKPTLEDLQPLYQAVAHGCQAGLQQDAHDSVWFARIRRHNEYYSVNNLGAFGSDLGAVACFFETPWSHVSPSIKEDDQAVLMSTAASWLQALGRLTEALDPLRAALAMGIMRENWEAAATRAGNLSGLELTLGDVAGAVEHAEQAVAYAENSSNEFERMKQLAKYAWALHGAGRRDEAEAYFRQAEVMQVERQSPYPLLYGVAGFWYCDLMLAEAERAAWQAFCRDGRRPPDTSDAHRAILQAVSQRAASTLEWVARQEWLLDIALDYLTLSRAALYEATLKNGSNVLPPNAENSQRQHDAIAVTIAVDGLRRSGNIDDLPRGLLTRAWQHFLSLASTSRDSARHDLDEAWEISERGPMPLFLADIHLHRARLFFREQSYPWESPQADLVKARQLIEKHSYGRRKEEWEDAETVIGR